MTVVSNVPSEILSDIFYLLCNYPIYVHELNNFKHNRRFPWAVGLVSKEWRATFISSPPLWARLDLRDKDYSPLEDGTWSQAYSNEVYRRLRLYLDRSGEHPLNVTLRLGSTPFTALELLLGCSRRWKTLELMRIIDEPSDLTYITGCKGNLPILESLSIDTICPFDCELHCDLFKVAPRLKYAMIRYWELGRGWVLPWTQLTTLELRLYYGDVLQGDMVDLLRSLHNVECLHIWYFYSSRARHDEGLPRFSPISLKSLQVLEVHHPAILSWIKTPLLRYIRFVDMEDIPFSHEQFNVEDEISSLIRRSGCKITEVAFKSRRILYFGMLLDLEILHIDYINTGYEYDFSTGVLAAYTEPASVPKLRFLNVCMDIEDVEGVEILVSSKTQSSHCWPLSEAISGFNLLQAITLEFWYDVERPELHSSLVELARKCPLVKVRFLK